MNKIPAELFYYKVICTSEEPVQKIHYVVYKLRGGGVGGTTQPPFFRPWNAQVMLYP